MATVIGIFENQYKKKRPLTVVRPGNQTRRFTHIFDTVNICYEAYKKKKCCSLFCNPQKVFLHFDVAKMFKSRIIYLKPRPGERYRSALIKKS